MYISNFRLKMVKKRAPSYARRLARRRYIYISLFEYWIWRVIHKIAKARHLAYPLVKNCPTYRDSN
jgi:hypothetical protein